MHLVLGIKNSHWTKSTWYLPPPYSVPSPKYWKQTEQNMHMTPSIMHLIPIIENSRWKKWMWCHNFRSQLLKTCQDLIFIEILLLFLQYSRKLWDGFVALSMNELKQTFPLLSLMLAPITKLVISYIILKYPLWVFFVATARVVQVRGCCSHVLTHLHSDWP